MCKCTSPQVKSLLSAVFGLFVLPLMSMSANASSALATDLQALVNQANDVKTFLSGMVLNPDSSCSMLGNAIASVESMTSSVDTVSSELSAPISMDLDVLNALDSLSTTSAGISAALPLLSAGISGISTTSSQADIQASLDAMLTLSDDIGKMADRILEMADMILVMADNIGLMADRILLTQQIQSTNMVLAQSTILATQKNIIALSNTVDTSVYNNSLSNLINTGKVLSIEMGAVQLTETNMASELADYEIRVDNYLNSLMLMVAAVNSNNQVATSFLSGDSLTMLGDLSEINAALAAALSVYAQTIDALAPNTNSVVLNDSVNSMLRLAADIGLMGDRIVEIGDDINIMADNIGLMAGRIMETQTLQQYNQSLTQSNITAAQIVTISVIAAYGL